VSFLKKGFTVLELLVVIAIIGFLASIVVVFFPGAMEKAKISRTQREMKQIYETIIIAQHTYDNVLKNITGHGCSECACRDIEDLSALPDDHQCILNWENVATKINFPNGTRDAWGSPYLVDENELEFVDNPCRQDFLRSAGPDKKIGGLDDIIIWIPFYSTQCKY